MANRAGAHRVVYQDKHLAEHHLHVLSFAAGERKHQELAKVGAQLSLLCLLRAWVQGLGCRGSLGCQSLGYLATDPCPCLPPSPHWYHVSLLTSSGLDRKSPW